VLAGEKTDQEPARAFVRGSHEAVDPAMLPRLGTLRVLMATRAGAGVDRLGGFPCHKT
jgi:hypothetical protein